jgi:hypothetical protein
MKTSGHYFCLFFLVAIVVRGPTAIADIFYVSAQTAEQKIGMGRQTGGDQHHASFRAGQCAQVRMKKTRGFYFARDIARAPQKIQ